eukprot:11166471-Lingulodinium_polyedra.AAC.1
MSNSGSDCGALSVPICTCLPSTPRTSCRRCARSRARLYVSMLRKTELPCAELSLACLAAR